MPTFLSKQWWVHTERSRKVINMQMKSFFAFPCWYKWMNRYLKTLFRKKKLQINRGTPTEMLVYIFFLWILNIDMCTMKVYRGMWRCLVNYCWWLQAHVEYSRIIYCITIFRWSSLTQIESTCVSNIYDVSQNN